MNDPEHDQLLQLPFDQYQRYQLASDLVGALDASPEGALLDVGGAPGFAERFFPGRRVFVADVAGEHPGPFVRASGAHLPFPDRSFSTVISLDTLEHVPPPDRSQFLDELRRVAELVVLCAPFADPLVELAESALHEFVRARIADFSTLEEHTELGLPDLDATVAILGAGDWPVAVLPSGYLPRWLVGMLIHHELLASGLPELRQLHAFYNATVSPLDTRAPAYRQMIATGRNVSAAELEKTVRGFEADDLDPSAAATLQAITSAVLAHRLGAVFRSGEAEALRVEVERTRDEIAALDRQIADRDAHIVELRTTLDKLLAGPSRLGTRRQRRTL